MRRTTAFAGAEVASGKAGLLKLVLGWAGDFSDAHGNSTIDARIKANSGADWAAFTGGRVTDVTYVTGGIDVSPTTNLPHGFFWVSQLTGLVANQALPDTER